MYIEIPENLTPTKVINFSNYIEKCVCEKEFVYDFKNMQHCHPYGLLVVASAIRNNMRRYPNVAHRLENIEVTQGGQFAATFGFYQSVGHDVGWAKEEEEIGYRYIPIKEISARDLHQQYTDTILLNEKVERQSYELTDMLVADQPQKVKDAIQYCFREIIRNTFEHGRVDSFWVCGQYWPARDEAEIAVMDEGIGILKSLQSNSRISAKSCEEANYLALQPGMSRTIGLKQDPMDIWQNSGYGLYVASTLCAMTGGYFIISSGNSAVLVNNEVQQAYSASQKGTVICLNIKTNSNRLRNFDNTLKAIVEEGQKKASDNGEKRILTASQVTTIASMVKHIENTVRTGTINTANSETIVPSDKVVSFLAESVNRKGEIIGTFKYNGKIFKGSLQNVATFNRNRYVNNSMPIEVVVRNLKNGRYTLLEKYKLQETKRNYR